MELKATSGRSKEPSIQGFNEDMMDTSVVVHEENC